MPQLTIKGIGPEKVQSWYQQLSQIVAQVSGADRKDVKVDQVSTVQFGGEESFAKVEVLWLKGRSQQVQDETAAAITAFLQERGHPFVQVTFTNLPAADFYENGRHY